MLYFLYPNMKKKLRDIRLRQNVTTEKTGMHKNIKTGCFKNTR